MESTVGDRAMLGKLLEEHRPRLLAMVDRRIDPNLSVRISAEDVVNEAFFVANRRYAAFKHDSSMTAYAWLYRIVLDCILNAWRRETRGRRDLARDMPWPTETSAQLGMRLMHQGTSPSEAIAREELKQQMRQAVELLRPKDQEILWMRHLDQLTHKEAGDVLGIKETTATLRYTRALRRLKEVWKALHKDEEV